MSNKKTAIVIGSGVAGLAASIRLANLGFKVAVYETNAYPGGKISMFEKDGFRFDAGPSLFTQPSLIEELFQDAGEDIGEYFKYKPKDISCKYFFENDIVVNAFADAEAFADELQKKAGEPRDNVLSYLKRAKVLYNSIGSIFLNYSLHKKNTWLHRRILKAIGSIKWPYIFHTLDRYNRKRFITPEAQQIFNRYATYNGSNPYKAPAMLCLIPHLEINDGTYYPEGGMISITNALFSLAKKKAVEFHFNCPVQKIVLNDNECTGIVVNNQHVFADTIVSNADIYFTYKKLLNLPVKAKNVLKQERSSSALIFYWGIRKPFPGLGLHNIFFAKDYEKEFEAIFEKGVVSDDPTVYINITCKEEKEHAPAGKENWFVMVNVPANKGQDWHKLMEETKLAVIKKLSRILQTDIGLLIESETILDPLLIESKTGSYMGSLYGTSSNSKMAAFFRHPNFTGAIKNLYHCGGSVHPGGGIPLCLKSAKITADIIAKDVANRN